MKKVKKRINISLSVEEWEKFNKALAETPYRSMQEFGKRLLLGKPATIYYRNKSFDEFTNAYIGFKKIMTALLAKDFLTWDEKELLMAEFVDIKIKVDSIYDHYVRKDINR